MNRFESALAGLGRLRRRFDRTWHIAAFERAETHLASLSRGDRAVFGGLAIILCLSALGGLYALQQSLLVRVPSYGGTVVEGTLGSPRFINPLLAISDADRDLSALVYAGLMGVSGSGELVPVLAESVSISPEGRVYTFTIREGARFSDGTPVTANDVVFTVQKAQDPGLKSPEYADWAGVSVLAVDERTVRFTLQRAYAPFLGLTTLGILPARLWQSISSEEFPFSNLQTNPVGAGPFKIRSVSRGASGLIDSISLERNTYYALGKPYLDGIRFVFYSRADELSRALTRGTVESAYGVSSPNVLTAPYARVFGVFWNPSEKQVYARAEVRKALSYALDRNALIDSVLGGYATAILGPVPPGGSVVPTPIPTFEDPTQAAAEILENAGWTYDSDARIWKHAGAKQSLEGITIRTSNVPELKGVASAVKSAWEKLGIPVAVELYEPGDLSQNVIRPRKYEALLYGMVIGRDQDLYAFWDSKERNDPGLNIAQYANKTVDDLLEDARSNADPIARAADLQKIEDIVAAEFPAAFIYAPAFTYAIPEDLYGVEIPQVTTPADRFATAAQWYRKTDAVWPFFANNR